MTAIVPQVDPATFPQAQPSSTCVKHYEWEGGHATGAKHITLGTPHRVSSRTARTRRRLLRYLPHGGGCLEPCGNLPGRTRLRSTNIAGGTSAWFAAGLPMTSENGEAPAVVH